MILSSQRPFNFNRFHYNDVTMGAIASQTTSLTIVYSTVYSGADQRKHESSASLAFVRWIHRGPVNSPHKGPVTRKMFPFDDVIMFIPEGKFSLVKYHLANIASLKLFAKLTCWHHTHKRLFLGQQIRRQRPFEYVFTWVRSFLGVSVWTGCIGMNSIKVNWLVSSDSVIK